MILCSRWRDLLAKITVLLGHSGAGKSTLVNRLVPEADRRLEVIIGWDGTRRFLAAVGEIRAVRFRLGD